MRDSFDAFAIHLLLQAPTLFAAVMGLFIARRCRHKVPSATPWVMAGFGAVLLAFACTVFRDVTGVKSLFPWLGVPFLTMISYLLLLCAVYAGRRDPALPGQEIGGAWLNTLWDRPGLKRDFWSVFFLIFLAVFLSGTVTTFLMPDTYSSTVRFRVKPAAPGLLARDNSAAVLDDRLLNTELEFITSDVVLEKVIKDLELVARWHTRYQFILKPNEALKMLSRNLEAKLVPNTSVIEVEVFGSEPMETADIANAVALSYQAYHENAIRFPKLDLETVNAARPTLKPVRPNKKLNIMLAIWVAGWAGLAVGLMVTGLSLTSRRRTGPPSSASTQPACAATLKN